MSVPSKVEVTIKINELLPTSKVVGNSSHQFTIGCSSCHIFATVKSKA